MFAPPLFLPVQMMSGRLWLSGLLSIEGLDVCSLVKMLNFFLRQDTEPQIAPGVKGNGDCV